MCTVAIKLQNTTGCLFGLWCVCDDRKQDNDDGTDKKI